MNIRRSIFYSTTSFIVILLITILIILYASGYTYNLQSQRILKTGIIKISSTPTGADVYINSVYKGTSPISFFNLIPGTYSILIKKSSYIDWDEKVNVAGGQLSSLYPILYPSSQTPTQIESTDKLITTYFSQSQYAFTNLDKDNQLNLYTHYFGSDFLNIGEVTQLTLDLSKLSLDPSYILSSVTFSPTASKVLLTFTSTNLSTKYFYTDTSGSGTPVDLDSQIDTTQYSHVSWGGDDAHLILGNKTILVALNTDNGQKVLLYQAKKDEIVEESSITPNLIYFILTTPDGFSLDSEQLDGTSLSLIVTGKNTLEHLIATPEHYVYADPASGLFLYTLGASLNPVSIKGSGTLTPLSFSPDGNILLYSDGSGNLFTYTIDTAQTNSLNIPLSSIQTIKWSNTSRILLYTTKVTDSTPQFYTLNGINFDGSNNDVIFSGPISNPDFMVSPKTGEVIFEMNSLSSAPGANEKGIYQIAIPGI